jgi:DNA-binding NarL/FixJ family response regulator
VDLRQMYGPPPSAIRLAAVALRPLADRARALRAAGDDDGVAAVLERCAELVSIARDGAAYRHRPKFVLGPEGRGWLARAEAEYARALGDNHPKLWRTVLEEFGPAYLYESARTRWRLAEALAESGARDVATSLGARPLLAAIEDLARRARLTLGGDPVHHAASATPAYPAPDNSESSRIASLTEREREVLDLLAEGRSNREIATALFIAPKTASVHVSNILGKLRASSRTEAAAIARRVARLAGDTG